MGGSPSKEVIDKRHVVIIGAGYGGISMGALLLKWKVPFTIVDPKEYFHHCVGALRSTANPDYTEKTMINLSITFGTRFVQATVEGVDLPNKKVTLSNGDVLEYTDLVFALGSIGREPGRCYVPNMEDAKNFYKELHDELDKATNVVIIGGGPVGVELAGEIGEAYKAKVINVIHSRDKLVVDDFSETFHKNLKHCLDEMGVVQHLGERVSNLDSLTFNKCVKQTVEMESGKKIEADIVYCCIGTKMNDSLLKQAFPDEGKFENGRIKVDEFLRVEGETNVYAIGDCCNTEEDKMAAHAQTHGETVAASIWNALKDQPPKKYKQAFVGMVVPVGTKCGAGVFNGWNVPSWAVSMLKGKGLFTARYWSQMGQTMP